MSNFAKQLTNALRAPERGRLGFQQQIRNRVSVRQPAALPVRPRESKPMDKQPERAEGTGVERW